MQEQQPFFGFIRKEIECAGFGEEIIGISGLEAYIIIMMINKYLYPQDNSECLGFYIYSG